MIRKKSGKLIYQPLDNLFSMITKAGSLQQKYDAGADEYIEDRTLTPLVLQPHFELSDSQNVLIDGDYTSLLVNCVWTVTGTSNGAPLTLGTHYTVNPVTHALTLTANLDPDTSGTIRFHMEYVDPRRKDVLKKDWEERLSCVSESVWKVTLDTLWPMRSDLFPWKDRGTFGVPVQLYNGDTPLDDARCTYRWQVFEEGTGGQLGSWRNVVPLEDVWCKGGQGTKQLLVAQKYIEHILIRCQAWPTDHASDLRSTAFMLRRFCGAYDDDLEILQGAYIFPETMQAVAEAFVEKRDGGRIPAPEQYFDIEILYTRGDGKWWHVAHGTHGVVPRSMFPTDTTMQHLFGAVTRELSAFIPLSFGGSYLTLDGSPLVAQVPVIDRDVD